MATCDDFRIRIQNNTDAEIKATKFEYRDQGVWKTENMFGIDGHAKIEKGHGKEWTRDLGGIGGEDTRFRVTYRHHLGGGVYASSKTSLTGLFEAKDNGNKTVTLTA